MAAYRYLVFLEMEKRHLVHELFPRQEGGAPRWFPCDPQVNALHNKGKSPLDRAVPVLERLGIDPHADAHWWD